jgi:hypothetical protein
MISMVEINRLVNIRTLELLDELCADLDGLGDDDAIVEISCFDDLEPKRMTIGEIRKRADELREELNGTQHNDAPGL